MSNWRSNTSRPPVALDRPALLARAGGDAALARELLTLFAVHGMADAERILSGLSADEGRAVAHRLRGAALAVGAEEIAMLAAAVEAGEGGEGLADAVARFRAALQAG